MAKKQNPFQSLDLGQVKIELERNVNYISLFVLEEIEDEFTWNTTANGGMQPVVTTSIEQKLDSFIVLLKDSIDQLKYITDIELSVSEFVSELLTKLESHMREIQDYFDKRPPESLTERELITSYENAKGKTITVN